MFSFLLLAGADKIESGNRSYEAGEYKAAIEHYSLVISEGNHAGDLYYNLGNAHYRNGELGKAIWAYESALKIEPGHEDALFNLEFTNAQTMDKIDTLQHGFGHWLQGLAFSFRINLWVFVSLLSSALFAILITIFLSAKNGRNKNISLFLGALVGLIMFTSVLLGYLHKNQLTNRSKGVIISGQVAILISPIEDGEVSFKLDEGARVELISEENDWVQISLNGNKGWLLKGNLWEI